MTLPSKEAIEIAKLNVELPRISINIIIFLATANAFLIREQIGFQSLAEIFAGIAYAAGIVLTVYVFLKSYNFIAALVSISKSASDDNDFLGKFKNVDHSSYRRLKRITMLSVLYWVLVLPVSLFA